MANHPARQRTTEDLLLVPTLAELELVREFWPGLVIPRPGCRPDSEPGELNVGICGFGLVSAAAQTARLLAQYLPRRAWLLGIAGTYGNGLDVGLAMSFHQVACYGIGVGTGSQFQSAEQMGWLQWPGDHQSMAIGDRLDLVAGGKFPEAAHVARGGLLLSVAAASASMHDVELRKQFCPDAVAEDMEGFAVAVACRLEQVSLTMVRGISNVAGDRNKANWKIRDAMKSAVEFARQLL